MWGEGYALRGMHGSVSVDTSVHFLMSYQNTMYAYYLLGWFCFFCTNVALLWVFYPKNTAAVCTIPLVAIALVTVVFATNITAELRLDAHETTDGRTKYLSVYDGIGDLDSAIGQGQRAPPVPPVPLAPQEQ